MVKKSMVATTVPPSNSGKHTPLFTPTCCATGARTQSVS
jgi:hypothetical protein